MSLEQYYNEKWDKLDQEQNMLEVSVVSINYSVEVNVRDFNDLYDYSIILDWEENLPRRLEKLGCSGVDFDPFFGAYILFQLDQDSEDKETWQNIKMTIKGFIEEARQWREEEEAEANA